MMGLKEISNAAEAKHLLLLMSRFKIALPKTRLAGRAGYPPYIDALLEFLAANLQLILQGRPDSLVSVIDVVRRRFPDFHAQAKRKRSSQAWNNHPEDGAAVLLVEKCFDYDKFALKSTSWCAYQLVDAIGARVCPYCQLHHINYHMPSGKKSFSLRPPLDHFLPRSNYPYLAVSLGNLVPCCSQCNSSVKLAIDPLTLNVRHPRVTSPKGRIRFSAKGSIFGKAKGKPSDVQLTIISSDLESEAHVEAFKLKERYEWYSHEIIDLIENHNRFLEYSKAVRDFVWGDEFILGFAPQAAPDRALGLCLLDVLNELKEGAIA